MTDRLNLLTDIEGVRVGHATDLALGSGVTVVVFDEPAIASGSVLGGAPGGRDTALLDPAMTVEKVDALVLSGGSAFGLDAAGGVQAGLREIGRGLQVGSTRVPIVPQAILMDLLNGGNKDWGLHSPYREMGYEAFRAASKGEFALGTVGAGTGRRPQPSRAASVPQAPSPPRDIASPHSWRSMRWARRPWAMARIFGPPPLKRRLSSAVSACQKNSPPAIHRSD